MNAVLVYEQCRNILTRGPYLSIKHCVGPIYVFVLGPTVWNSETPISINCADNIEARKLCSLLRF